MKPLLRIGLTIVDLVIQFLLRPLTKSAPDVTPDSLETTKPKPPSPISKSYEEVPYWHIDEDGKVVYSDDFIKSLNRDTSSKGDV
jgi:hypothetical protein